VTVAALLAVAERAVFHGAPGAALPMVDEAERAALAAGAGGEAALARWLRGVALGASGRYGTALTGLGPLLPGGAGGAVPPRVAALAAATAASIHRQLGRHAVATPLDRAGLGAAPAGPPGRDARLDCLVGLAADAVGAGDAVTAGTWLGAAARELDARGAADWRPRCRVDWVRVEIGLLTSDPGAAAASADAALRTARHAAAPRHEAKSLLFLGVALAVADDPAAVGTLHRAAALATELGAVPLVWPASAMLARLLGDADPAGAAAVAVARDAVARLAADLPPTLRDDWLAAPDVRALSAG